MTPPLLAANFGGVGWIVAVAIAVSVPCALLGCYLVLRRLSMLGDAISHAVLPGIVVGFLLTHQLTGAGVVLGALAVGVLTAFLTHFVHQAGRVPEDAVRRGPRHDRSIPAYRSRR
jgi:manganese/zinc/iron transport system permease protein